MECPYCKKEMCEGNIPATRDELCWYEGNHEYLPLAEKGMPLTANPLFKTQYATAHYCPDCRIVIVPVPTAEEVEGPLTKLEKKLEARREQRDQERVQRQVEKDAEKKQQKREKTRKKDPWEV